MRGRGRCKRRRRSTRKGCGSNLVTRLVGRTVKGNEDNRPVCDLINAFSWLVRMAHVCCHKLSVNTLSNFLLPPTSGQIGVESSSSLSTTKSSQTGATNPALQTSCRSAPGRPRTGTGHHASMMQRCYDAATHCWMAFLYHLEAVSPTAPKCYTTQPNCVAQAQSTLSQREGSNRLCQCRGAVLPEV